MSKELKITKEKVLEASESCPDAKGVLKTLFPEAFKEKEKWVDITNETKLEWDNHGDYWNIHVIHKGEEVAYICDEEMFNLWGSAKGKYKIERNEEYDNWRFRILERSKK